MTDVIGTPALRAEFDSRSLLAGAKAAGVKLKTTFEESNRAVEAVQRNASRRIQGLVSQINAEKPRRQMFELSQAVQHLGGTANLTEGQLAKVRREVERLTAAGAKAPKSLAGVLPSGGGGLGGALGALTSGGGISGVLGALGPAGVAAAAGIGAVAIAGTAAVREISALAGKAEQWTNMAKMTGLGVREVQQLTSMLEDAGIGGDVMTTAMRTLHKEIADGGKDLQKYGIDLGSLQGLTPEEQLQAVAQAIMNISDANERGAAAQAAFGRAGEQLIPVLAQIAEGSYKVIGALGEKQVAALNHLDQELDKAGRSWSNFSRSALGAVASVINALDRFDDRTTGRIRNPVTESLADFNKRIGRIRPEAGGISLGPETSEQSAAKAAYQEGLKKQSKKQEEINELLDRAKDSARKLAFNLLAAAGKGAKPMATYLGIESLPQARPMPLAAVPGGKEYDFGLDAQGFVTWGDAAKGASDKTKETAAQTVTWADRLSALGDQLQVIAQTTGGLTGKLAGFAASLAGGLGGILSGFKTAKDAGGGLQGVLAKAGGYLGMAASAIAVGGTIISGIKSLFGGGKEKKEAAEASKILGENVSREQLKSLKEEAKQQGKDWRTYLKERKAADDKQRAVEARQKLEQGLSTARGGAEGLMALLEKGGLSAGLTKALQTIIGKVGDALLRSGLGILDARLQKSEAFTGAQQTAQDIATVLAGMREAGLIDEGLLGAAGAAAGDIQQQAIDAALAAGMTPEQASQAGSAAIAPLLREQLNASLQSGKELDENTKALLEEARKNGIEILADPAIESLDVQKEQLGVLREIAGKGGPGEVVGAASGLGPVRMPNVGGGLGPLIQTHAKELALVLPAHMARPGAIIQAAEGLYRTAGKGDERERERRREPGEGPGGGGGDGDGGGGGPSAGAPSPTGAELERMAKQIAAQARPISISTTLAPQITEDPLATKERREDLRRFTVEELRRVARERDPETMFLLKRALGLS